MPTITSSTTRPAEFVLSEASGQRSRENIIVTQTGVALKSGTVISRLTADGKYVPYDNVGTDGSEVAAGILYSPLNAATGDVKAVAFVRDCEVIRAALVGINTDAIADLKAVGVIVRGTV
jgi:hypothetical protein